MENLQIHIEVNPELYVKNPDSTELGRKIISKSIEMIYEMGFEAFTFKKLGTAINSPESSIYRYFESKHMLLIYLTSWYWNWTEYKMVFAISNIASPVERLNKCIEILTQPVKEDTAIDYVNEVLLSEIIFSESIKAYHNKNVDEKNKKGAFRAYKNIVRRVGNIVLEIKKDFPYPHMLISTVIEGAHHQKYFSEHLPSLTDASEENSITKFYKELVFNFLK